MTATLEGTRRFVSIGLAAEMAGCSPQAIRDMELRREIPPAARVEGMDRRLYSLEDVALIRQARETRRLATDAPPAA